MQYAEIYFLKLYKTAICIGLFDPFRQGQSELLYNVFIEAKLFKYGYRHCADIGENYA